MSGDDPYAPAALAAAAQEALAEAGDDAQFVVIRVSVERCCAGDLRGMFAPREGEVLIRAGAYDAARLTPDRLAAETMRALALHSLFSRIR